MSNDTKTLGAMLNNWHVPPVPANIMLHGQHVAVVLLDPIAHSQALWQAYAHDTDHHNWRYLPYGPFADQDAWQQWLRTIASQPDPYFVSIIDQKTAQPVGMASYLRISPEEGSIEVGHIHFSPLLQQTRGATEAMFLMMQWVFTAGYRRYEWKCNALNMASRRAAQRFGFSYEGIFRQATIAKGRNRDTAWFAMIDQEWPALHAAFTQWLDDDNFDRHGRQRTALSTLTASVLYQTDPAQ